MIVLRGLRRRVNVFDHVSPGRGRCVRASPVPERRYPTIGTIEGGQGIGAGDVWPTGNFDVDVCLARVVTHAVDRSALLRTDLATFVARLIRCTRRARVDLRHGALRGANWGRPVPMEPPEVICGCL